MNLNTRYYCWEPVASKKEYSVKRMNEESGTCIVHSESAHQNPVLPDSLFNPQRRLYISKRLKVCLEKNAVTPVEYLRIKIIDPTGLVFDDSYFMVRFLNAPPCLDLDASGATRSRLLPTKAEKLERLMFKNDPDRPLFQPAEFNKILLVSTVLAEALAKEGFSGFRFMGLFDYGLKDLPSNPVRSQIDALCKQLREVRV